VSKDDDVGAPVQFAGHLRGVRQRRVHEKMEILNGDKRAGAKRSPTRPVVRLPPIPIPVNIPEGDDIPPDHQIRSFPAGSPSRN